MKEKKVWRYWCEYCNKAGLQKGAMRQHERHCTMNPKRVCRVCAMVQDCPLEETQQHDPVALAAMLPDPSEHKNLTEENFEYIDDSIKEPLAKAVQAVREVCGGCPACIMAALRQRGIPVPLAEGLDFKKEMQSFWDEINERKAGLCRDHEG